MPVSLLWAVDVRGRVYRLSTGGQQWEQCHDTKLEFKRVTAATQCCWGIACDHNIYLNVHASDLSIRYQEETYENQVGSPLRASVWGLGRFLLWGFGTCLGLRGLMGTGPRRWLDPSLVPWLGSYHII